MSLQYQRMLAVLAGCGVVGAVCGAARAQALHDADWLIRVVEGMGSGGARLEAGAVGADGAPVYPSRVRSAVLGAEGVPNFTNDPGVDAERGVLVPGMSVGFDLVGALREWDGTFDAVSDDTMTVRKSGIGTTTPAGDGVVEGIVFGQADLDPAAGFHHHVQFILNSADGGVPGGVWLLTLELWTDAAGVARTGPLYAVFAQGSGEGDLDGAVAWVEANLVGGGCVADVAEPLGVLNFFDVSAFIGLYTAQDDAADLAAPFGAWNFFDVSAFIAAYNAGCP